MIELKGYKYMTDDPSFVKAMNAGVSQPYTGELTVIKEYLKTFPDRNRTFIDIGAHIGTFSIPLSDFYKYVYSYEVNPKTVTFLKKNIEINKIDNIRVFDYAVTSHGENVDIVRHGKNSGCFTAYENKNGSIKSVILEAVNYDRVDLIKIDVEGAEMDVLRGISSLILKFKPMLIIEANGLSSKLHQQSQKEIFDFIKSFGYVLYKRVNDYFFVSTTEIGDLE